MPDFIAGLKRGSVRAARCLRALAGVLLLAVVLAGGAISPAWAACTGPDGDAGVVHFDEDKRILVFCDGEEWVQMGEAAQPNVLSVVTTGLTAYWPFDDGTGTLADDAAGTRNGTLTCAGAGCPNPTWINGRYKTALMFNPDVLPKRAYVQATAVNVPSVAASKISLAMWIKPEAAQIGGGWLIRNGTGVDENYGLNLTGPASGEYGLSFTGHDGTAFRTAALLTDGISADQWSHIAVVFSQGEYVDTYVNGIYTGQDAYPYINVQATNINIGGNLGSAAQAYNGAIDDVRIYGRALTADEVRQIYYGGDGCTAPDGDAGVLVYNDTTKQMQYCNGAMWVALGGKGTGTYSPTGSGDTNDDSPAAFNFVDQTNVALNALATSAVIVPAGYMVPVSVSVTGDGTPEISINGGAWGTSGTISPGQTIAVRLTSANTGATLRSATVTIGGISDVWNVTSLTDTTPNAFSFTDQTGVAQNTLIASNSVTIAGINYTTPVSVSGDGSPQIRINGGSWGTSGNITSGQTLEVRLTSASAYGTARVATVNVGGVTDAWSVSTLGADTTPDAFTFTDVTGAAVSTLTTSADITIAGINTTTPVSVTGVGAEISINGGAWGTSGNITSGQTLAVRLTSSASMGTAMTATVNVGGVNDTWSVTTVASDTAPNAFDFTPNVSGANLSTLTTAGNTVTISGINAAASVSVSGDGSPQISINGGAWGTSGTITNGQTLQLRLTSSNLFGTTHTATVNVGGVTDMWSVTTAGADTTPNAFDFTPNVTNANLSTLTTASAVTITGINTSTPVSVTGAGAQISINGGTWVTSGNITSGQTLNVRLISSATVSTAIVATVTVGTLNDTWSVTTRAGNSCSAASQTWLTNCTATVTAAAHGANGTATITNPGGCGTAYYGTGTFACSDGTFTYSSGTCTQQTACDTTPNAFTFTDVTNAALSTLTTSANVTIAGINTSTPVSVSGGGSPQISINGGAWGTSGTITNGQTLAVRLTSSASNSTAVTATVDVGGVTDVFSVTTTAPVVPGSQTFSTAGSFNFTVPNYNTLTVQVWGAGSGGQGESPPVLSAGGQSSWDGTALRANGGGAATTTAGGAGGTASGGTTNITGGNGSGRNVGGGSGAGGAGANGGAGGSGQFSCPANGSAGTAPGGGGSGARGAPRACNGQSSGGGGGYTTRAYSAGTYAVGASVPVVVGAGGAGGNATYDGGNGAPGRVTITWN